MRVTALKTYKIFIDGKFPRSESGRTYALKNKKTQTIANVCLCSRKDVKAAVVAARNAQPGWWSRTAYNRSQILYRVAEMMEGRREQFAEEMKSMGLGTVLINKEISRAIDLFIHYAGWCDKYQQVYSSVNPVASPHYNFSVPEPMGVVGMLAPEESPLAGLAAMLAPAICGGNTCVVLVSEKFPLCAITFAEVLATSDVPAGVINILSGQSIEMAPHLASHLDVNALVCARGTAMFRRELEVAAAANVKRFYFYEENWTDLSAQGPGKIMDLQEIKTTWHPIENIGVSGNKY